MDEFPQLPEIIWRKKRVYAERAVRRIKTVPKECMQSGDDSPCRNFWEEFVVQIQGQHSFYWQVYEGIVTEQCQRVVERLDDAELALLWFRSDHWVNWEDDELPGRADLVGAATEEIYDAVMSIAANVRLRAELERFLEPGD